MIVLFGKSKKIESTGDKSAKPGFLDAGFTLIELVVVLGIFALIMSVALFDQAKLSSNVLVTNLAYETALAVREAQTYGISVRATASATPDFEKAFGVYLDISTPTKIIVFGDSDGDNVYDAPTELQSLYEIMNQRGNKITAVCLGNTNGSTPTIIIPCSLTSANYSATSSVMFRRPNPESNFYKILNGSATVTTGPAVIVVNNTFGTNCRAIIVEVTGQIRVENSSGGNCVNVTP